MNTLAKKLATAFVVGAGPVFLGGLLDVFDAINASGTVDTHLAGTVILTALAGAMSAGIRYAMTALNWVPGDETVGLRKTHDAVTISSKGADK